MQFKLKGVLPMPRPSKKKSDALGLYLLLPMEQNTKLKALAKADKRSMQNVALPMIIKAIDKDFNKIFGGKQNVI